MLLKTADWNDAGQTHNALATESKFLTYSLSQEFTRPAKATIILADTTGSMAQKYDVDAAGDSVYIGAGRAYIEDPTGTCMFNGRIVRAINNMATNRLILECEDWLSQLDDERITYDMREDLDGNGLRQSEGHADPDGAFVDVAQNAAGTYYFFDDDMTWANDAYNNMFLVFTGGMAGDIIVNTGAYTGAISATEGAGDFQNSDWDDTWEYVNANAFVCWDNDESWTQDLDFRVWVGHNTPSDLYTHDSITGARFHLVYGFKDNSGEDSLCEIQVYDVSTADYVDIGEAVPYDNARGTIVTQKTIEIPGANLDCVDANGIMKLRFNVTRGAGTTYLYIYQALAEVDVSTTGYGTPVTINDTITTNKLAVATDLTAAATRIWEGIPYSICQPIYKHIDTGNGGTLISDGDLIYALTADANIEHNASGISLTRYSNRTRLQILQSLAKTDKSVFWIPLGGVDVKWKYTFNDGAPTALTDANVLHWTMNEYDWKSVYNHYLVYGARYPGLQLTSEKHDATSLLTYGNKRTGILNERGLLTQVEADDEAALMVDKDKDSQYFIQAEFGGNTATAAHATTLKLGDEVSITSSYLGLSADVYTITHWAYDSATYRTLMRMHPRKSQTGHQESESMIEFRKTKEGQRIDSIDKYIPDEIDQVL